MLEFTGCGPIQRKRHFTRSVEYFSSTPIAEHVPANGAHASWYLIQNPETSAPYLLERITSKKDNEAGTAIVLLQVIAASQYRDELIAAIDARDWESMPGSISDYVLQAREFLKRNEKGMMEK